MDELGWLERLLGELEAGLERTKRLRRYKNNEPNLPEMGDNLREAWGRFQRESATNWAELIVDPVVERIVPNSIVVDGDTDAETAARRIWRDNRLDANFPDMVADMLATRHGFFMVTRGQDGKAQITVEDPELVATVQDPVRAWKSVAAVKVWRDRFAGKDFAYVWHDGYRVKWERDSADDGGALRAFDIPVRTKTPPTSWELTGERLAEDVPIIRFDNRGNRGEFEQHIPLIDRINRGILNRLVIAAAQAFRARALVSDKDGQGLPTHDDEGNEIDYGKIFESAPGAIWELPPGVGIWESSQADIRQLIEAERADIRQLSAVSRTPMSVFIPDSGNQSATGAEYNREGLINKAHDRIKRIKPTMEVVLVKALRLEGFNVDGTLELGFEPTHMVTVAEKYDAGLKAKAVGLSLESIQRNILGYSQTQIQEDRAGRWADLLNVAQPVQGAGIEPLVSADGTE